jgi:uncharacterized membrane protein
MSFPDAGAAPARTIPAQPLSGRADEPDAMTRPALAASARPLRSWLGMADLAVAAAVAALAGVAQMSLPGGSWLRVVPALLLLFFVPGYLLIEAVVGPAADLRARLVRCAWAVGVSPPVVALLALATALAPHGFKPAAIVLSVTVACLGLAAAALWRRTVHSDAPHSVASTA